MTKRSRSAGFSVRLAVCALAVASASLVAISGCGSSGQDTSGLPNNLSSLTQVNNGRILVITGGCGECHSRGKIDPSDANWLGGFVGTVNDVGQGAFNIGGIKTFAANITPDTTNGVGRFTNRQIFNALRYGLDPESTPDVIITSTTPGQGNFPATPHYLAPPMPWPSVRHSTDEALWSIVAYIKHGIKPVANVAPPSGAPADFWASAYTAAAIGPFPIGSYPQSNELYTP
jgi:hypothetical protein